MKNQFEFSEISLGYLLNRTALYIRIAALQLFKANNFCITPEQFGLLYTLSREDGLYQRQLSKILLKDRPNITRIVDILVKKGFVTRISDPGNRRIYKLYITDEGKEILLQIIPKARELHDKGIDGLTKDDMDNLKRIMGKIRDNFEENFKIQI